MTKRLTQPLFMALRRQLRALLALAALLLWAGTAGAEGVIEVPVRPVHATPPPSEMPEPPPPARKAAAEKEFGPETARDALKPVVRSEDDLVLLDVMADGAQLLQGVPGYVNKSSLILPLGQLTEALEFPIRVKSQEGLAEGWFYRDDNRFTLDVARHEATTGGDRQHFDPNLVEIHDDDIYVDTRLLEKWLALRINFTFASQTVTIAASGKDQLPIQVSSEREKRKERLSGRSEATAKNYPTVRAAYKAYSWPYADFSLTGGFDQDEGRRRFSRAANMEATGDLLYMSSDFFGSYDNNSGFNNIRWSLSRHDPDGELLSDDEWLRHTWIGEAAYKVALKEFTVGDIFTPEEPLTARNQNGRGVLISNQPAEKVSQFNRTTLEGNIQPGWDVELYRNDELLAFQRAGSDGRYVFVDVPLLSGLNLFRLVFYGPYSEKREEIRRVLVTPDITKAGQSYFRFGAVQQGRQLLPLHRETTDSIGTDGQATTGGVRSFFEYEYGLRDNLALFAQAVHTSLDTGQHNYGTLGLGTSLFGVYARIDGSYDSRGGKAAQATVQTNLFGVTFSGLHQRFMNFLSDFTENSADPLQAHSEVRADTPVKLPLLPRLNFGVSAARSEYKSGHIRNEVGQRTSAALGRLALSNNLSWQTDTNEGSTTSQTDGDLTLSAPLWSVLLRGSAHYGVTPQRNLQSVAMTADKTFGGKLTLRGELERQLTNSNLTTFTLGLSRQFERFQLGVNGSYDTSKHVASFVNVTFSVGQDPQSKNWHFYPDQLARDGIVSAHAFVDKNHDGLFDSGDEPAARARVQSDGGGSSLTDGEGYALLNGQRTNGKSSVTVDDEELENPSWVMDREGYSVITRPGVPVHVDFPIVSSGSADGTIYLSRGDGHRTVAANVVLQLTDSQGKVVRETRSSFDGYFSFERIRPGQYRLQISADQLKRRNLKCTPAVDITIKGEDSILSGLDFVLSP